MGLDLWFREDVARILAATHETMSAALAATTIEDAHTDAYRQGFEDALRSTGIAFGVVIQEPPRPTEGRVKGGAYPAKPTASTAGRVRSPRTSERREY
jgi:hypothetical protein